MKAPPAVNVQFHCIFIVCPNNGVPEVVIVILPTNAPLPVNTYLSYVGVSKSTVTVLPAANNTSSYIFSILAIKH